MLLNLNSMSHFAFSASSGNETYQIALSLIISLISVDCYWVIELWLIAFLILSLVSFEMHSHFLNTSQGFWQDVSNRKSIPTILVPFSCWQQGHAFPWYTKHNFASFPGVVSSFPLSFHHPPFVGEVLTQFNDILWSCTFQDHKSFFFHLCEPFPLYFLEVTLIY